MRDASLFAGPGSRAAADRMWLDIDRSETELKGFDGRVRIEADRNELREERVRGGHPEVICPCGSWIIARRSRVALRPLWTLPS